MERKHWVLLYTLINSFDIPHFASTSDQYGETIMAFPPPRHSMWAINHEVIVLQLESAKYELCLDMNQAKRFSLKRWSDDWTLKWNLQEGLVFGIISINYLGITKVYHPNYQQYYIFIYVFCFQ